MRKRAVLRKVIISMKTEDLSWKAKKKSKTLNNNRTILLECVCSMSMFSLSLTFLAHFSHSEYFLNGFWSSSVLLESASWSPTLTTRIQETSECHPNCYHFAHLTTESFDKILRFLPTNDWNQENFDFFHLSKIKINWINFSQQTGTASNTICAQNLSSVFFCPSFVSNIFSRLLNSFVGRQSKWFHLTTRPKSIAFHGMLRITRKRNLTCTRETVETWKCHQTGIIIFWTLIAWLAS